MPSLGVIGVLSGMKQDSRYLQLEWRIPKFFSLSNKSRNYYDSPEFAFSDARWRIALYPNCSAWTPPSDRVRLYLVRTGGTVPVALRLTFGVKGAEGVRRQMEMKKYKFSHNSWSCLFDVLPRHILEENCSLMLPNNTMTISCRMRRVYAPIPRGIHKVVEDMRELLASGQKSDITVEVENSVFRVHSNILSARSPVLSAMLAHDTAESASMIIRIDDCKPDIFQLYLQYLYTGSVQSLSENNVFDLFVVADKYLADDLKLLCFEHIRNTLCVETFCETAKLALTHGHDDLLQMVVVFASQNFPSIVVSPHWLNFFCDFPKKANEILIKCFGPKK